MFDDFHASSTSNQARKRFGGSMAASTVLCVGLGAVMVAATATARHVMEEEEQQVEFAPPPEPEPEPPPPEPEPEPQKQEFRPKVKRQKLEPPDKISDEKLKESDRELSAAGDTGPQDGFLDGVEGGKGTRRAPPPPPKAPPKPPVLKKFTKPPFPSKARRKNLEGSVRVSFVVTEDGRVTSPKIISGPEEFHEAVLKTVVKWRFSPAMRDGKPVAIRLTKAVVFRLDDY